MKKIYTLALLLFTVVAFSQAQDYKDMIAMGSYTVEEIQTEADAFFAINGTGKGTGYKQFKRWEYQALRDSDANGYLKSPDFYYNELERYNNYINQNGILARSTNADSGNWLEQGPNLWNATSGWNPGVGRITAMAFHKSTTPPPYNHFIVGSQTGGVWKTLDGGNTWTVLTDNFSNMEVYSLAIHPTDPTVYFWGSAGGTIFKSEDSGATWNILSSVGTTEVNRILIDPSNPTKMYCSVEHSGLYKSTDSGASWSLIHAGATGRAYDFEFKPGDPNTVYASGVEVFKSTDGGATFSHLVPPAGVPNWTSIYENGTFNWKSLHNGFEHYGATLIHPKTGLGLGHFRANGSANIGKITKIVTPAMDISTATSPVLKFSHVQPDYFGNITNLKVYYKTSAAGSWVELANYTTASETWQDVTINLPSPSADYYVAFEGIANFGAGVNLDDVSIEDTTLGVVFSDGFETPTPNIFNPIGAKMLAVTSADPNMVYMLEASSTGFGHFEGIYKSTDSGSNFSPLNHTGKNYFGYQLSPTVVGDATSGQAPRDMDIAVSPSNADEVHIAGVSTWRSLDGAATFQNSTYWHLQLANSNNLGYSHADVDMLEFVGTDLFTTTDGGIFKATDSGGPITTSYFTDLTAGLGIRQFYAFGISQTDPVVITGGSQDNGSSTRTSTGAWRDWLGGDGMEGFVDKTDPNIIFGTVPNGHLYKSLNGGVTFNAYGAPGGVNGNWVTPIEQDPVVPNTIYGATDKVYKSTNDGISWSLISQDFGLSLAFQLKVAQSMPSTMYVGFDTGGGLYKTTTGSAPWTAVSSYTGGFVTSIAIHPSNPDKVAVATNGAEKVYVTSDGGTTWTSYKYDLPNFIALALVWDDNGNDGLYVGMNYGIYYIDNTTGNSWKPFNNGLPNVKIAEMEVNYADNKLYTATYGRGVWSSPRFDTNTLSTGNAEVIEGIAIYPNPASDSFNISSSKGETVTVRVFNALGKLMNYSKDVNLANNFKIDVSKYATGVYFVRVNNESGVITKKLVVR